MKKISYIVTMLALTILSLNAQDCFDYTETNGTENFPGIYGGEDYTIDYDGSNQIVELGVYGFFNDWWSPSQADQTFFSVNGSDPVALSELTDYYTVIGGAFVTLNTLSLNDEYLSSSTLDWTSGTVIFSGAIETITMTQFESGLLFSCVEILEEIEGCDYQFEGDDPGFPGYIITNTYPFNFSGDNQLISIGYFDYIPWEGESSQYLDDSYFSVNGSEMFDLYTIYTNQPFSIGDVTISIDTNAIPEGYNVPTNMSSGTIIFNGEIDLIVTAQVESGIKFICVEEIQSELDCIDFTEDNDDPNSPGIYLVDGDYTMDFDSALQEVSLGIYGGFLDWVDIDDLGQADQTFFSVNGSQAVSLDSIFINLPFEINDVIIDLDTNSLAGEYPIADYWTSGTISFSGYISEIVMTQFESGLLFSCADSFDFIEGCDYQFEGDDPVIEGYIYSGTHSFPFSGDNQQISIGYFDYVTWEQQGSEWPADATYFSVNGSEMFALDSIYNNQPFMIGDVSVTVDTTGIPVGYNVPEDMTSGTIIFEGIIDVIETQQVESGIKFICVEEIEEEQTDCQDFTIDGNDPEFPGLYGGFDATIPFDGTDQMVSMGIYGVYNDWGSNIQQSTTFFTINGGDPLSLEYIQNNAPLEHESFLIDLDITSLNDEYLSEAIFGWTSGTIVITGAIDEIIMTQSESGMLFACTEPISEPEDCIDYTEENDDPNAPGIYLIEGDYILTYDSTHQEVSLGVYGFFDWSDVTSGFDQSEETYFSVNGGESVSLETIYLNQPYVLNDIEITVDTTALNDDYPLADYWPSGTILFTGHISEVIMTQLESGLLFSCSNPAEEECECEECACQIDADFTYVNISNYYSFVSSVTGTEYSWDFGDGVVSSEENPTHQYASPGGYEVCLTNYNLTDTCSIMICKSILFMANTPEAHIITPNGDGYDDEVKIFCNNVTVYNRNGIIVAELLEQEYWDGTDGMSIVLPMGEYILKCNDNEVIQNITVIR